MAGRFLLDRSIFRYAEKPYTDFEALVWLIASAKFSGPTRGTLLGGRDFLAEAWGWDASKVRQKLKKWEKEGRILCYVRNVRTTVEDHLWDHRQGPPSRTTVVTVITIPKYDEYQKLNGNLGPPSKTRVNDQGQDHRREPHLNEEELTKKKIQTDPTPPPSASAPRARGNLKSFDETRKIIEALDLDTFRTKYPHLNIDDEYQAFYDHFLFANDLKSGGKPNWKKWSDWNRAFHNWCNKPWKKTAANEDWRI